MMLSKIKRRQADVDLIVKGNEIDTSSRLPPGDFVHRSDAPEAARSLISSLSTDCKGSNVEQSRYPSARIQKTFPLDNLSSYKAKQGKTIPSVPGKKPSRLDKWMRPDEMYRLPAKYGERDWRLEDSNDYVMGWMIF